MAASMPSIRAASRGAISPSASAIALRQAITVQVETNRHRGPARQIFEAHRAAAIRADANRSDVQPVRPALPRVAYPQTQPRRHSVHNRRWFPYRSLIEGDWTETLREFIPRIAEAPTRNDYQLELIALIARIGDTHANLWSSLGLRPPVGACHLPVNVRFIEGLPMVTGYSGSPGPFRLGDVLDQLDGA